MRVESGLHEPAREKEDDASEVGRRPAASKVRLDRDTILAAALELAATPGVSTISFRELGAHLSVDPTAVYRHFRNKEDLMKALLDELALRGIAQIDVPVDDWQGRLRAISRSTLRQFELYPAIGPRRSSSRPTGPANSLRSSSCSTPSARWAVGEDSCGTTRSWHRTRFPAGANIARARAEDATGIWLDQPVLVDPREFPLVAANSALLAELRDDDLFLAGVEVIIDSAERTVARAPGAAQSEGVER